MSGKPITFEKLLEQERGGPWVMKVPVVSTSMFPSEDVDVLELQAFWRNDGSGPKPNSFILIVEDFPESWPIDDLAPSTVNLIRDISNLGYPYLRIDPDGEIVQGYKTFDW